MLSPLIQIIAIDQTGAFVVDPVVAGATADTPADFLISLDGGDFIPLANTPTVSPGRAVITITLSDAEAAASSAVIHATGEGRRWSEIYHVADQLPATAASVAAAILGTSDTPTIDNSPLLAQIERTGGVLRAAAAAAASAAVATEDGVDLSDDAVDAIVVAAGAAGITAGITAVLDEVEKIERSANKVEAGGIVAKRLYEPDGTTIATNADGSPAEILEQTV